MYNREGTCCRYTTAAHILPIIFILYVLYMKVFHRLFWFVCSCWKWIYKKLYILTLVSVLLFFSFLILIFLLDFYVKSIGTSYTISSYDEFSGTIEVGLILWAGVNKNGSMSAILQDRVATAVALYKKWYIAKILVSADNSRTGYDEVSPVKDYLLHNDVPAADIFLDYAGFDTYDSLYRAKYLFEVQSILVITQEFHLSRALWIARSLGLDAYGFRADKRPYLGERWYIIREIGANIKSFFEIIFGMNPKFMGEIVPIDGESNALN